MRPGLPEPEKTVPMSSPFGGTVFSSVGSKPQPPSEGHIGWSGMKSVAGNKHSAGAR